MGAAPGGLDLSDGRIQQHQTLGDTANSNNEHDNEQSEFAPLGTEADHRRMQEQLDAFLQGVTSALPESDLGKAARVHFVDFFYWAICVSLNLKYGVIGGEHDQLSITHSRGLGLIFAAINQFLNTDLKIDCQVDGAPIVHSTPATTPCEESDKQEIVGWAAMASQAAYNQALDPGSFPKSSQSHVNDNEEDSEFCRFAESFRETVVTPSDGISQGITNPPTDEKELCAWFKAHQFNWNPVITNRNGLALLVEGKSVFMAAAESESERKYYIIAIRGTIMPPIQNPRPDRDWMEYFVSKVASCLADKISFNPVDVANCLFAYGSRFQLNQNDHILPGRNVHAGFYSKAFDLFTRLAGEKLFSGERTLIDIVREVHNAPNSHLIITGHSQGAADAVALSALIRLAVKTERAGFTGMTVSKLKRMMLVTFAQPSLGNEAFHKYCVNDLLMKEAGYLRIVRQGDLITAVPGKAWGKGDPAVHFGKLLFQKTGLLPLDYITDGEYRKLLEDMFKAHNSGNYLTWVYNEFSKNFAEYIAKAPAINS